MRNRVHNQKRSKKFDYTINKVQLVRGGHDYFALVDKLIRNAKQSIHLQTYIFEDDKTGQDVANALIDAAKRDVVIYLLVDGYASQGLSTVFIDNLVSAGIHFRYFEPMFKSRNFYFGRRLHSKVLVTDASEALVGGVNITDRYNDMPGEPAWLDFALYVKGPAALEAYRLCISTWRGKKKRSVSSVQHPEEKKFNFKEGEGSLVRLRRNDWVNNRLQISNSYLEMFRTAKSTITILSSYALPGIIFRRNLLKALRRGVKVRMIVSGVSDVLFVRQAEKYWYDWLFRNNIEVYEYTKNVLHGKLAICDGEWMTIGSYNVNDLSAYVSIELNFDVKDPGFVGRAENIMQKLIDDDCLRISSENFALSTNVWKRLGRWCAYNIIRLSLGIFTFYYRRQQ